MESMGELSNIRPVRDRDEFLMLRQDARMFGYTLGSNMVVLGQAIADPGRWVVVEREMIGNSNIAAKYRAQVIKLTRLVERLELRNIELKSEGDLISVRSTNYGWVLKEAEVEPVREVRHANSATIIRKGSAIQSPLAHESSPRTPETGD